MGGGGFECSGWRTELTFLGAAVHVQDGLVARREPGDVEHVAVVNGEGGVGFLGEGEVVGVYGCGGGGEGEEGEGGEEEPGKGVAAVHDC